MCLTYKKWSRNVILADFLEWYPKLDLLQPAWIRSRGVATRGNNIAKSGCSPMHPGSPASHNGRSSDHNLNKININNVRNKHCQLLGIQHNTNTSGVQLPFSSHEHFRRCR